MARSRTSFHGLCLAGRAGSRLRNWGAEASARRRSSATTLHDWARVSLNAASKSSIRRDFRRSGMMASCGGWVKADQEIDCRYRAVAVTGSQPVVKVWRRTETVEAPRRQGATTENTGSI